ncbi:MAG: CDP-glycerol glycerophosphotransferase family protein [Candidatus Onthomonas sp.]
MGIKDAVRSGLKRESPLFQAIYKGYKLGVRGLYALTRATTKLDEHLVVFDAFQGRQYTCSPKALYQEMLSDPKYKDYRFIWALTQETEEKNQLAGPRTQVVRYNSRAHKLACARAKYIVTNSMPLGFFRLRKGQELIETWHGTPLKRLGCDIEVDSNSVNTAQEIHQRYQERVQKITTLLSPSDFYTEKLSSAFALKDYGQHVRIIQQGYPRNDFLSRYTPEQAAAIKARLGVPEGKKVILYAPTFRDNQKLDRAYSYGFTLEMDFDHLLETLGEDYVILFRPHYFVASQFDFAKYEGRVFNVAGVDDVNEVYIISDMLITDYSSVFFDYAILKRPILLFMYDLELYQGQLRDFYIDLKELPFPILRTQEQLEEAILDQFQGGFQFTEGYQRFNQTYTPMDDGGASRRVLAEIFPE